MAIIKTFQTAEISQEVIYKCDNENIVYRILQIKNELSKTFDSKKELKLLDELQSLLNKCEILSTNKLNETSFNVNDIEYIE